MEARIGCIDDNVLAGYLDGKLRGKDLNDVEAHLAACPSCLEKLTDARFLMKADIGEVPEGIQQKVKDLVAEQPRVGESCPWPWWEFLLRPSRAFGLALCSVIIIIACYAGTQLGHTLCDGIGFTAELVSAQDSGLI